MEFHFTDGFFDDVLQLIAGDLNLTTDPMTTRMQTGLAHVETLHLTEGKEVTLISENRHLKTTITVDAAKPYVIVALVDGAFEIAATAQMPGYL